MASQIRTYINRKLQEINQLLGVAPTPFSEIDPGKLEPNPGNIHLDNAYGGHSIRRMSSTGSGDSPLLSNGYVSLKVIEYQLEAYHAGLLAGRDLPGKQVS